MQKKIIKVNDKFQNGYKYELTEPIGKNFHPDFKPELTPKEMLALGVFGGKYMTDCKKEFPKDWFIRAKLSPKHHDDTLNFFHKHASQPLRVWINKGWINCRPKDLTCRPTQRQAILHWAYDSRKI